MKKLLCLAMAMALTFGTAAMASNPEIREADGELIYQGDPAALVVDTDGDGEGDTVYLYLGHDVAPNEYYSMPDYLVYSSTDMVNWKYEGSPLSSNDFTGWGGADQSWAGQAVEYNGMYYWYTCKNGTGISVAWADTPTGNSDTGRFTPLPGGPLIDSRWTNGKVGWDDIDPTVWIENDENGEEHRYLCWGNGNVYIAELNEDMISLTDLNGDGEINGGDITEIFINDFPEGVGYTEAPWLYKRPGSDKYYLFFASNWREELSYAVSDNIRGPYEYAGLVMTAGASSNTNHPAVIDFKGETYFIYHTGALERGTGFRRSVCIDRLVFDAEGGAAQLEESSVGLDGTAVKLSLGGVNIFHTHFENSYPDNGYPMGATLRLGGSGRYETDSLWEIVPGLIFGEGHVSIQSVNKMGYYVTEYEGMVKLLHDDEGTEQSKAERTFIARVGVNGTAYESLSAPGKYLSVSEQGDVILADSPVYFTVTERLHSQLSAAADGGAIAVYGVSQPGASLVIVIKGPAGTSVDYAKAGEDGEFNYTFSPAAAGRYEISAAGRTVSVKFGGEE